MVWGMKKLKSDGLKLVSRGIERYDEMVGIMEKVATKETYSLWCGVHDRQKP